MQVHFSKHILFANAVAVHVANAATSVDDVDGGWGSKIGTPPPKNVFASEEQKKLPRSQYTLRTRQVIEIQCGRHGWGRGIENRWNHRLQKKTGCNGLLNFQEEKAN